MKKLDRSRLTAICFLLTIWICAIIIQEKNGASVSAMNREAEAVTWVIDAGHGGEDGGAVSPDGITESSINLDISLRLGDMSRYLGQNVILTRETEEIAYPPELATLREMKRWDTSRRVELIKSISRPVLISIHQNYYPTETPSGSQVLYSSHLSSRSLAEAIQFSLTEALDPGNRRVAVPADRDIYLMRNVLCPAVLVECGFLSNPRECGLLYSDSYRLKIAAVIAAVMTNYQEIEQNEI